MGGGEGDQWEGSAEGEHLQWGRVRCTTQDKGWYPENKLLFLWIRSKLLPPSPQFGKLVQLFSYVKIQDREVSLELEDLEDDPQAER